MCIRDSVYGIGSIYETGGTSASVSGSTLFNEDVRSELISSWEAGAEVRFFKDVYKRQVISFVGYATQEIKWTGKPLDVLLKDDTQLLGEVCLLYTSQLMASFQQHGVTLKSIVFCC